MTLVMKIPCNETVEHQDRLITNDQHSQAVFFCLHRLFSIRSPHVRANNNVSHFFDVIF